MGGERLQARRAGRPASRRPRDERGAAAVEFALVVPLLLTILFGIVEFGWGYAQVLDVRHGSREGARLVSVNAFPPGEDAETMTAAEQSSYLVSTICDRMDFADDASVTLSYADGVSVSAGATAVVEVESDLQTVTGWFDFILGSKVLSSTVQVRLEQEAQWAQVSDVTCP